jgi:hypothetical protein
VGSLDCRIWDIWVEMKNKEEKKTLNFYYVEKKFLLRGTHKISLDGFIWHLG